MGLERNNITHKQIQKNKQESQDATMSCLEEEISDLHLSLDCGDNAVRPPTSHIPLENVNSSHTTEYVASDTLYLSRRTFTDIADCILQNRMLKNLYLEGNQISSLPDSLFTSLSNLVWLDLRNNQIVTLPGKIGLHRCLKTLLLEGNPITELPLELGNVITLKALSLRHCPIVFPPQEIVQEGLQCILLFLRSALAKRPVSMRNHLPDIPPVEKLQLAELVKSSLDLSEEVVNEDDLQRFKELKQKMIQMDRAEFGYGAAVLPLACRPRAAEGDRGHKTCPLPVVKRDQEILREWRLHAKIMQEKKILEHKHERHERHRREETLKKMVSGCTDTQLRLSRPKATTGLASDGALCLQCAESIILQQSDGPIEAPSQLVSQKAPYATESLCSIPDSTEVTTHSTQHRLQKQRSFLSQKEYEEARAARDRELEQRIRGHVQMMQDRRRRPRGTAEEETAAARHDMEEAKKLQVELAERKQEKDLEYRFTAFTGESSPRCYDK